VVKILANPKQASLLEYPITHLDGPGALMVLIKSFLTL
jgi:hypothetical protein